MSMLNPDLEPDPPEQPATATDKAASIPTTRFPMDPLTLYRNLPDYPRDPRDSEFGFGPGLRPRGKERALPSEGGQYRGTTPREGRVSARDQGPRAFPGNPGERIR